MKKLLIIGIVATLTGCASTQDRYGYNNGYDNRGYGYNQYGQPVDADGWRVVSVTPVPRGTSQRVDRDGYSDAEYSSAPVYVPPPVVYSPAPVYTYPPVTFSLGLMLGRSWGGRGHHHHGGYRRHR